jgi:hypothetical protein
MAGRDGDAFAPFGAAAAKNGGAALGLHTAAKAVRLAAATAVGLERTFRHGMTAAPAGNLSLMAKRKYNGFKGIPATPQLGL